MADLLNEYEEAAALLLFLVPALLVVLAGWYFNGKRRRDLEKAAVSLGFAFEPKPAAVPDIFALSLPGLPKLVGADFYNAVAAPAPAGCRAWYADTRCRNGRGGSIDCSYFTFALFELQGKDLPAFCLRPENLRDKMGDEPGREDIDLPGYDGFSAQYYLRGPDRRAVERVFFPLAEFLSGKPGWTVSGKGKYLLLYKPDTEIAPGGYADFTAETAGIAAAFQRAAGH